MLNLKKIKEVKSADIMLVLTSFFMLFFAYFMICLKYILVSICASLQEYANVEYDITNTLDNLIFSLNPLEYFILIILLIFVVTTVFYFIQKYKELLFEDRKSNV